ncbi:hypothetical protein [Nocardioides pacificus]
MRRHRNEEGSALVELTWLGLLLLVPLVYVVLSVFEVQRGAFAVTAASRAAARAYALAETDAEGKQDALAVARRAFADQGIENAPLELHVSCQAGLTSCHSGTAVITVTIESGVELPLAPDMLGGGAPTFRLDATHSVPIGQFQER